ncbi:MAG: hypothetical protein CME36_05020 [unclassified Hahellaceae]|nr:hypothetical protein [Hahellaceae bacterium]|tara:strand:+ start:2445 stop:2717 length:273 start_codon:yes stop_codon:yes gene_type:complete
MNTYLKVIALASTMSVAAVASAGTGQADRINEARTYPFKQTHDNFLSSERHRKIVQLVQEVHRSEKAADPAKREKLHNELHEEINLHAQR